MEGVARKFLIRGEVQGVGYRFFAQRAAARLPRNAANARPNASSAGAIGAPAGVASREPFTC